MNLFLLFLLVLSIFSVADDSLDKDLKDLEKSAQEIVKKTEGIQKLIPLDKFLERSEDKKLPPSERPRDIISDLIRFAQRADVQKAAKDIINHPKANNILFYQIATFLILFALKFIFRRIFKSLLFRVVIFVLYWPLSLVIVSYGIPHFFIGGPYDYLLHQIWEQILLWVKS